MFKDLFFVFITTIILIPSIIYAQLDSDNDGLSDELEILIKSNPQFPNSNECFSNGTYLRAFRVPTNATFNTSKGMWTPIDTFKAPPDPALKEGLWLLVYQNYIPMDQLKSSNQRPQWNKIIAIEAYYNPISSALRIYYSDPAKEMYDYYLAELRDVNNDLDIITTWGPTNRAFELYDKTKQDWGVMEVFLTNQDAKDALRFSVSYFVGGGIIDAIQPASTFNPILISPAQTGFNILMPSSLSTNSVSKSSHSLDALLPEIPYSAVLSNLAFSEEYMQLLGSQYSCLPFELAEEIEIESALMEETTTANDHYIINSPYGYTGPIGIMKSPTIQYYDLEKKRFRDLNPLTVNPHHTESDARIVAYAVKCTTTLQDFKNDLVNIPSTENLMEFHGVTAPEYKKMIIHPIAMKLLLTPITEYSISQVKCRLVAAMNENWGNNWDANPITEWRTYQTKNNAKPDVAFINNITDWFDATTSTESPGYTVDFSHATTKLEIYPLWSKCPYIQTYLQVAIQGKIYNQDNINIITFPVVLDFAPDAAAVRMSSQAGGTYSAYTAGGGLASGYINDNGFLDVAFMVIEDPAGTNEMVINIGMDGQPSGNNKLSFDFKPTIRKRLVSIEKCSGGGAAFADIDNNGKLDLVVCYLDNPNRNYVTSAGAGPKGEGPYAEGYQFKHLDDPHGIATGYVRTNRISDVGFDKAYFHIYWNLNDNGNYEAYTDTAVTTLQVDFEYNGGAGLSIADLNNNGIPDYVFYVLFDYAGVNLPTYYVGYDINSKGVPTGWTDKNQGSIFLTTFTGGGGIIPYDLDDNGTMDLLMPSIESTEGGAAAYWCPATYDLKTDTFKSGMWYKFTNLHMGNFGTAAAGGGADIGDFNIDLCPDVMMMAIEDPYRNVSNRTRYFIRSLWGAASSLENIEKDPKAKKCGGYYIPPWFSNAILFDKDVIASIDNQPSPNPHLVKLYPNPFYNQVYINATGLIEVYNLQGQLINQLNQATWDGLDATGHRVPNGIYLVKITDGGTISYGRVVLMR